MTDDTTSDTAAAVRLVVPAELEHIGDVRRQLTRAVIDAGDDRSTAHDLALAASELCTNVVQYADTAEFSVVCERADDRWILEVSHADGVDLERSRTSGAHPPSAEGGRGLMIVRALMDTVEVVQNGTGAAIRCTTPAR